MLFNYSGRLLICLPEEDVVLDPQHTIIAASLRKLHLSPDVCEAFRVYMRKVSDAPASKAGRPNEIVDRMSGRPSFLINFSLDRWFLMLKRDYQSIMGLLDGICGYCAWELKKVFSFMVTSHLCNNILCVRNRFVVRNEVFSIGRFFLHKINKEFEKYWLIIITKFNNWCF